MKNSERLPTPLKGKANIKVKKNNRDKVKDKSGQGRFEDLLAHLSNGAKPM